MGAEARSLRRASFCPIMSLRGPMATIARYLREAAVDIRIHTIYLLSMLLLWILVYHAAYWLIALARDSSLVCWSVGLFGVSMVSLRQPTIWRLLAQLCGGALALA